MGYKVSHIWIDSCFLHLSYYKPKFWQRIRGDFKNTTDVGRNFEDRVAQYFRTSLKFNVKKNVVLRDRFGNKSEIDIVYGIFFKRYVECKAYSNKIVPLHDVAKFKEVLLMNDIPLSRYIQI